VTPQQDKQEKQENRLTKNALRAFNLQQRNNQDVQWQNQITPEAARLLAWEGLSDQLPDTS